MDKKISLELERKGVILTDDIFMYHPLDDSSNGSYLIKIFQNRNEWEPNKKEFNGSNYTEPCYFRTNFGSAPYMGCKIAEIVAETLTELGYNLSSYTKKYIKSKF